MHEAARLYARTPLALGCAKNVNLRIRKANEEVKERQAPPHEVLSVTIMVATQPQPQPQPQY